MTTLTMTPLAPPTGARRIWAAMLCTAAALLGGCAMLHPDRLQPGQDETAVRAAMGEPAQRLALDGGAQRLVYPLGPMGLQTWLVDLDAQGRVTTVLPALTPERFAQVEPGMRAEALLRWLGPPAHRQREWQDKQTWSWRFDNPQCLWARITLSAQGEVIDAPSYPLDPRCDPEPRRAGFGGAR